LNLANNRLRELPASLAQLSHLWELDVSNNLLRALPPEVEQMEDLKLIG